MMTKDEFILAVKNEYKPATEYEFEVFTEWCAKVGDRITDFGYIIREIIKNYQYKTFPPYKVYSLCGPDVSGVPEDSRDFRVRLREKTETAISNSRKWDPDILYNNISIIFKLKEKTCEQISLLQEWSQFYSVAGLLIDKGRATAGVLDGVKRMCEEGRTFGELKDAYLRDISSPMTHEEAERKGLKNIKKSYFFCEKT